MTDAERGLLLARLEHWRREGAHRLVARIEAQLGLRPAIEGECVEVTPPMIEFTNPKKEARNG